MVFFQDPKKGQDNTQKEKNVHFLSGGVLRRQLNKGVVGFLKKNLKMRAFFWLFFGISMKKISWIRRIFFDVVAKKTA